jgi:hypothetical protein
MGGEDSRQNLEELARKMEAQAQRLEALEQENRELREALGSGASERQLERPQQPQTTQAKEMPVASNMTVRGLLLGPRDEQAYSHHVRGYYPLTWCFGC